MTCNSWPDVSLIREHYSRTSGRCRARLGEAVRRARRQSRRRQDYTTAQAIKADRDLGCPRKSKSAPDRKAAVRITELLLGAESKD